MFACSLVCTPMSSVYGRTGSGASIAGRTSLVRPLCLYHSWSKLCVQIPAAVMISHTTLPIGWLFYLIHYQPKEHTHTGVPSGNLLRQLSSSSEIYLAGSEIRSNRVRGGQPNIAMAGCLVFFNTVSNCNRQIQFQSTKFTLHCLTINKGKEQGLSFHDTWTCVSS